MITAGTLVCGDVRYCRLHSPLVPPPRGHSSNLPSANSLLLLCPTLMLATPIPIHHAAQLFSPSILMPPFSVLRPSFIALVSGTRVRANRAGRGHRGVDECAVSGQREPVPDPREQRISGSGMACLCARRSGLRRTIYVLHEWGKSIPTT